MGRDPRRERAPRTTRCYAINKPRQIQNQIQKHSFKFRTTKIPIGRLEHCSSGTVSLHILLKECFDFCRFRWLIITALKNHCTQQLNIIIDLEGTFLKSGIFLGISARLAAPDHHLFIWKSGKGGCGYGFKTTPF